MGQKSKGEVRKKNKNYLIFFEIDKKEVFKFAILYGMCYFRQNCFSPYEAIKLGDGDGVEQQEGEDGLKRIDRKGRR